MKRLLFHILGGAALVLGLVASALGGETKTCPDGNPYIVIESCGNTWSDVFTTNVNDNPVGTCRHHKSFDVKGNTITLVDLMGDKPPGYIYGAVNHWDTESVSGNEVYITDGSVGRVHGGDAWLKHGVGGDADVSGNKVIISGGEIQISAVGGSAVSDIGKATANGNTVEITGGEINGEVFGGFARGDTAEASNNTVKISSGDFGVAKIDLVGGRANGASASVSTGNTLDLALADLRVAGLYSFQKFVFDLPSTLAGGSAMLIVASTTDISEDAVVSVKADPGLTVSPGDVFILIDASCGGCALKGTVASASQKSMLSGYDYVLSIVDDKLLLTVGDPVTPARFTPSPNTATFIEGVGGNFTVTATGSAPIIFSIFGPSPAGVSIDSATGVVTVPSTLAAGKYGFSINADNGVFPSDTKDITLTIKSRGAATTPVPATGGGVLVALSLLLAGLAVVVLRRNNHS